VALVLKVISSKICALMREVTAPNLGPADFDQLARGIDELRPTVSEDDILVSRFLERTRSLPAAENW
jgi:hypothetical protein